MEKTGIYVDKFVDLFVIYAPKLALAIIVLIIGLLVIKSITKLFNKLLKKRKMDEALTSFLSSFVSILLKVLLVISVIEIVGVQTTSFVAILAAAGFAVGMALSGTLQNFAGGVMLMIFKPFKVGDFIEAQGYSGTVKEIQIFNTILKTPDNKTIIQPNGSLATGSMVNFSTEPTRRVDFTFGIGYSDNIDAAKTVLQRLIGADSRILKDPAPFIAVSELADSSVNFAVRVWANSGDYWGIFFDMTEAVKKEFDKENISIPFPQTDVHMYNVK
ncbi:MAG: mechanosensitive ion channel [Bacteroidales bacterium]|nr:mechanosensitive ion channel [Bacteroidales bacterium]MCF8454521.1 mechanosensitive ion channel [Bacteroidales bacterium]